MKSPLVLLVNPWIYDFAAYDLWAKPLGLLYVAAWLRARGYRVQLWDAMAGYHPAMKKPVPARRNFGTGKYYRKRVAAPASLSSIQRPYFQYGLPPELLKLDLESMRQDPPELVLVTSLMTYWYPGVREALQIVRQVFPQVPVVVGGNYATLCPDHARAHTEADVVVEGPAEHHLPDILERLLGTSSFRGEMERDLWNGVYPAFDLLPPPSYLCVMTSRGCPYRCKYCASGLLFPSFIERTPDDVFAEIQWGFARFGVRDVAFYDDALLIHAERRLIPLLEKIVASGFPLRLHTPNGIHIGVVTPELARWMKEGGFVTLRLGYESADSDWHARMGGKTENGDLEKAVGFLKDAGFSAAQLGVYLLIGVPGQKPGQVEAGLETVMRLSVFPYLAEYSPIPGTELWEEACRAARFDITTEPLFHNNTLLACAGDEFTETRIHRIKMMQAEARRLASACRR